MTEIIVIEAPRARAARMGKRRGARIYTCREAAVLLRHSVPWIRKQIRLKNIRAVWLGRAYFIPDHEIERLMGARMRRRYGKTGESQEKAPKKGRV